MNQAVTLRHILITGASGAIGRALALAYAAPGCVLSLTARDATRLRETADACRLSGAEVFCAELDVTDTTALMSWITERDQLLPIDLAIANAGMTSTLVGDAEAEPWPRVEQLFQVNLIGTAASIHPLLTRMTQRGSGQIALMSSLGAYVGMPISPAYNASKAALKVYGAGLRGWLAPRGVRLSVICPGFVASAMSDAYPGPRPFLMSAEQAADLIRKGLAANRAVIAFPPLLALTMRFLALLPTDWSLALQRLFKY
jgi:short-subunit dehydrogenase